jgi:hypothetical protein
MLGVSNYPQDYIDDCRKSLDSQLAAHKKLVKAVRKLSPTNETQLDCALGAFDPLFFSSMVLVLDHYFCHRLRNREGKDGNPLNEARVIGNSIMQGKGTMTADKTIKLSPENSLLKYQLGDEIKLGEGDFRRLSAAFLAEIESRYR